MSTKISSFPQKGFTLLEVMVALAVVAVGLAGVMTTVTTNISNASGLNDRTIAHWVAMNELAELQVSKDWPSTRTVEDSEVMANHEWHIKRIVKKPDNDFLKQERALRNNVREVEIQVRRNEDDEFPVATLVTYIVKSS